MKDLIRSFRWFRLSDAVIGLAFTLLLLGVLGCGARPHVPTPVSPEATPQAAPPAVPAVAPLPTPRAVVPVPTDLNVIDRDGQAMAEGAWLAGPVTLRLQAPADGESSSLEAQVDVMPASQSFSGEATATGDPVTAEDGQYVASIVLPSLAPGQYDWQARFYDPESQRASGWAKAAAGLRVAGPPPSVANLAVTGVDHQSDGVALAGQSDHPGLTWDVVADPPEALARLTVAASHQATAPFVIPADARSLDPGVRALPLSDLADGRWYVHLWGTDRAGQIGPPATVAVVIDRTAPKLASVRFRSFATNPAYQNLPITFALTKPAVVTLAIRPTGKTAPVRTYALGPSPAQKEIQVSWDGRDQQGAIVPPGDYGFRLDLQDAAGNHDQTVRDGLTITRKFIVVSLSQERLWAYDGSTVYVTTSVTTGGAELPTRPGTFEIEDKESPFVFHSPYPRGSPFWYPDSPANYAMLFDPQQANFIHDSPWRSVYGPGTNGPGQPGSPYTGSHGCVDTPPSVMRGLFAWTPEGMPVIVKP